MRGLSRYYISRTLISAALGGLFALTGASWWMALLATATAFAFFLWAPRSGRYAVQPRFGVTALRHDERTRALSDKAARNAFVVTILAVAAIAVYFGSVAQTDVPIAFLSGAIALAALTYFLSDLWLRRS